MVKALLNHRCYLYDLVTKDDSGSPITSYVRVSDKPIRCRLDLTFVRSGKDRLWMDAVGRPQDRMGIMFFDPSAPIKSGIRAEMLKGPKGVFQIQGAIDEAWGFDTLSHYEVGVVEVSTLQWRGNLVQEKDY